MIFHMPLQYPVLPLSCHFLNCKSRVLELQAKKVQKRRKENSVLVAFTYQDLIPRQ